MLEQIAPDLGFGIRVKRRKCLVQHQNPRVYRA
jgi:hypothetical protein